MPKEDTRARESLLEELEDLQRRLARLEESSGERARAQAELRAAHDQLQATLDALPDLLFEIDREGRILDFRAPHPERLFAPPEEFMGKRVDEVLPVEAAHVTREAIGEAIETGRSRGRTYSLEIDGEELWFELSLAVKGDPRDADGRLVAVARDITGRRRAEEALRESEARYRQIVDNAITPIEFIGLDGRILLINEIGAENLGRTREELIGCSIYEILPDLADVTRERIERVIRTGSGVRHEDSIRLPGGIRWFLTSLEPVRDSRGAIGAIQIVSVEITENKRAEEERRELEAKLLQAQKLESLGLLAGGIAHDFNNLLLGVLGNADLALLTLSEVSPVRPRIEEIKKASLRAAELTRQMLAYSGRGSYVVREIDLTEVVDEMLHLLESSISKKVRLRVALERDLPAIEADPAQVQQIAMNLITNASEACGEGGGDVAITTGAMPCSGEYLAASYLTEPPEEGEYVFVEVSDTGCGMDEETRTRMFDPFFSTKFTGRGLGLAAVLGIVRSHRGALLVESEPGRGTTIRVLLPSLGRPARRPVEEEADRAEPWRGGGAILVVDDEEAVRETVRLLLERAGFEVLTAADGLEGLEIFRRRAQEIVCVLLDLTMPEMGGEEVLEALLEVCADARVILSSGYDPSEVVPRLAERQRVAFIQKPYRWRALRDGLRSILEVGSAP